MTIREGAALRALTLAVAEDGTAALGGYSYEPNEARAMAGQLALAHALGLAAQAGPLAQLEVLVRASMRTPDEVTLVAPEDSPTGFDGDHEVQWLTPSVWGDIAVYVTFHLESGVVRVEDFN